MKRILLAARRDDREAIVRTLERLGAVELDEPGDDGLSREGWNDGTSEALQDVGERLGVLRDAIRFISLYDTARKPVIKVKRDVEREAFERASSDTGRAVALARTLAAAAERLRRARADMARLGDLVDSLRPWTGTDLDVGGLATEHVRSHIGTLPAGAPGAAAAAALEEALREAAPSSVLETVGADARGTYLMLLCHADEEKAVLEALRRSDFARAVFHGMSGTAAENVARLETEREAARAAAAAAEAEAREGLASRARLETACDHLLAESGKLEARSRLLRTERVFLATGWLPEKTAPKVEAALRAAGECAVELSDPGPDDVPPVLLSNPKVIEPFEAITSMFSLPGPGEIDPSPFLAPFYFIFFGIMLGDAAYGIILSAFTGLVLLLFKPKGMMDKMLRVFFLCGISTLFWGALFGGWMGDLFGIPPIWFNPLDDPMTMLLLAMAFGVLQVLVGLGLKAYLFFRKGDWKSAVFDVIPWFPIILGIPAMLLPAPFSAVGKWSALAGAAAVLLMRARTQRNPVKRILMGLYGLYDIVGYLSDIISYSRLLALGLASGVIANVFNTMGRLGGKSPTGYVVLVVVVLIGTVFNIAVNVLGSYVHSTRLQYIEFFTKFYEGGGRAFRPFKAKTEYADIIDREAN